MSNRLPKLLTAGFLSVALTGCAVRTSYKTPTPPVPHSYEGGGDDPAISNRSTDLTKWWENFDDPTLNSLVERAIAGNLDLKIAEERIREARATAGYTSASRQLPNAGASGGFSERGSGSSSSNSSLFQTGFDTSYELDLFGGAGASVKAANADAAATQEAMRNTLVSITAETARDYMLLRQSQERLAVAQKNLAAQEDVLRLTQIRRDAGLVSNLDTTRAEAQAATTRAAIPLLEAQVQQSIHAIALLLGRDPNDLQAELSTPAPMPASPPEVPVGLPSDLLRRRPDIRQAEQQIAGSAARVGVAVSNLYPKFSLTSSAGGQSNALLSILSGAARLWSFGSSFSWGLLNYPATKANINAAESRERQSMATYEQTVLTALGEVEDSLAAYTKEKERHESLVKSADANQEALRLANIRYKQGLSSFLDVLDAQRSVYSSEDSLTQSRANVNTDLVALYKALGGGW